jgi:phage gp36-like protein
MIFLTTPDMDVQIRTEVTNVITNNNSVSIDKAERAAIEEMQSYLRGRYDVANIFNKSGNNRNPMIVMYLIDMMVYHLHSATSARNIPELRGKRYDDAISWLKSVAADRLNPDLPIKAGEESGNIKLGGNPKVIRRW